SPCIWHCWSAPPTEPPTDSCELVKCRVKELCVKGECVHVSTATCRAVGDPHYVTFDGRRFNFQGTCTYIMTTVTKTSPDLPPFTVTTTNNHRGNTRVSYVRTVTVSVNGGELQYLPVSLLGGKVSVTQSGIYAVLTTDFGLNVKYDWNMRLYIVVPSSYYQHLGGLCGNYNGDRSDDLPEPKGSSISAVLNMIQKWKTDTSDLFCHDNCAGHCAHCSKEQQAHFSRPNLCGILTKSDGPFSACHKKVDPFSYLENCVYDVCVNKGAKQILCNNLKSYADACMSEDVKINPQWRMVTKCFLSCPKGSHYEACGSACPASCMFPDLVCKALCVEGCQCDKGLVLSGDRCVPLQSCGCQYQGRYYPSDITFWGDNTCTTKCKCIKGKAKVGVCVFVCLKTEHCALKGGVRGCYPISYATCRGSGDPHYQSFDGQRFDFQGTCTYTLSELTTVKSQDLEPFQVLVQNENRGRNKAVAYTKSVSLTVFGNITVSMSRVSVGRMLVRLPVNLPYSTKDGKLSLYRCGYSGYVKTDFGLTLRFNWDSYVTLTLPSSYSSATGLCGNYNGNPGDDLVKPDGTQAKHVNAFGDSWKVRLGIRQTQGCLLNGVYTDCGLLHLCPYRQCHSILDHTSFLTDCVFDLCMYRGHVSALCNSLSAFSTSCQVAGAKVGIWRTKEFCPPLCGANSHYELCGPPCPLTCSGPTSPAGCDENAHCTEGCVCDDGFLLSNDKCVPLAECGCQEGGQYYQTGQVFYPEGSCDIRCVCSEGGHIQCDGKFRCSTNEMCVVKGGVASCSPSSIGSCSVSGVRIIRSFDGQVNKLTQCVDDIRVSLPVSLADGQVRAHQNGLHIIIETDFGLKLIYDSVAGVFLQIPSTYRHSPRGLCGNYTGEPSDNQASAAAAWVVTEDDTVCDTSCGAGAGACPVPDEQMGHKAKTACDIIRAQGGPFAGCHSTVSPTADYDACVREMSTGKRGADIMCRHIQNYVTACQLAGTKISKWRSDSFCPVRCPAGSHYELCSSSSCSTCSSLQKSEPCPVCQEGCQCDDGLLSDGVRCVPIEKCGCVVHGQYYGMGKSILLGDCSERCVCQSGNFSCSSTSCNTDEECRNRDGAVGCYPTDPCAEVKCRVKEHCEVSEGHGVCVPNSKALCWTFGDPHYNTFDHLSYSFQGTCTYVLLNTTGLDPTLPEVTVITKNELRGKSEGSFVRSATVEMLGHLITLPNKDRGVILVDGIKRTLPVILDEGSISITESGIRGILQSDIGIEVTFDWSTLLMISISSSYYGNVAGLCGNYNGDKGDDLTTASGHPAVNVTQWAGTWSIEDDDPFCYHYCEEACPQCTAEDRIKYTGPEYCGILSDKKGPFSGCHGSVPLAEVLSGCLYDACINEGRQEVLCEALSSYLAKCQEAGASVLPWRHLGNCSAACPAHSQYKMCGTACPATCGPQPKICTELCVEGCFCDPGYVHNGKECVIREKGCGCNHDDRYYLPGVTFWTNSLCEEKCVCDAATQKVKCERAGCRNGERCGVVNGVQGCYLVSFETCIAHGDPHFKTFDGRRFDFQGNCIYRLAGVCGDATGLTHFEVNLENNNRGNKRVSYAKVVTVNVYDNTYTLSVDFPGRVLWKSNVDSSVEIGFSHGDFYCEGLYSVRVELASSYHNATCGLCGKFNGDPADDLALPNGKSASSANDFGVSQWVADVDGCSHDCKNGIFSGIKVPLPPNFKPPAYASVCDVITAKDGPMSDCLQRVDSKQYRDDCIYDMVLSEGEQRAACDIISGYVEECQRNGGRVKSWRTRSLCCKHSGTVYSVTAPGCPISCTSPSPPAKCESPPGEGCVCNPGYLLSEVILHTGPTFFIYSHIYIYIYMTFIKEGRDKVLFWHTNVEKP
uniref:VWFD domain-containing protein n=1 Tax=Cyclopterus lumpus TaxID=8103 RepID=A0A8C2WYZ8_CYCLU